MKITISREFDSVEDAIDFLHAVGGDIILAVPRPYTPAELAAVDKAWSAEQAPGKKLRKPRSDAGQPRGPYKKSTGEPAASEPGTTAISVATTPAAPVAPTQTAAPQVLTDKDGPREPSPATAAVPAPITPPPNELTLDDVKAAMHILNKKHGIEANMKQLAAFGVEKSSLLPKEKYGEFIAAVRKAAGV